MFLLFLSFTFLLIVHAWRPNPSFALHNFDDVIMTWCASMNNLNQDPFRPAGICQLRWDNNDYQTNYVESDGFSFIINDQHFTNPNLFSGSNSITYPGEYAHNLQYYNDKPLSDYVTGLQISKNFIAVPAKHFIIEKYEIVNNGDNDMVINILDYVNSTEINGIINGGLISNTQSLYLDYSNDDTFGSNSLIAGLYATDTFSLGETAQSAETPVNYFDQYESLDGNQIKQASTIMMAFQKTITIPSHSSTSFTSFRALFNGEDVSVSAETLVNEIQSKTYDEWKEVLLQFMNLHTANYKIPSFQNLDEEKMWNSSLLTTLFSQNPSKGTLVASYHPLYEYKVWTRDAIFSSIILTAIGEFNGAAQFLRWLATAELRELGNFATTYSWWDGSYVGFVEPQYDSVGVALTAYYYYTQMTKSTSLINEPAVKNRIRELESFLLHRDWCNLIRPDYSIWEESSDGWTAINLPLQYYAFTQIHSHHGLKCAQLIEEKYYNDESRSIELTKRAEELSIAFEDKFWNEDEKMFVQAIWEDNKRQKVLIDASTASLVFSDIISDQDKIKSHLDRIRSDLTKLDYGIARYVQDPYFYSSKWNVGGVEANEASPPWGVVTMFMSWAELLADDFDNHAYIVEKRLQWMMDHTGPEFIPCGEAVDGISGDPVLTSMPDVYEHAGVYILTRLQQQGLIPKFSYKLW
ncbi:GH15-like domain-containing protein [Entamoeba marina]